MTSRPAVATVPVEHQRATSAPWRPTRNTIRLDQPMSADELDRQQPGGGALSAPAAPAAPAPRRVQAPAAGAGSATGAYRNCRDAWAAGAAPLYRGQPGYGAHMDGDGDGIACEPYHGG
ncbi:excalibur calcium-binding domain-containing protein [Sphingobium sp. HBC34]|uniref:Excalibur calcium-binding domain-containing protein n=1 Tax=Sphingobium cyanobacteriorum TaxID=3063954 RepID=A0ABT8ZJP4_9SPHN|nr:excalibur calcium-binding domain-containing protein [Sphingobium sp. HBC34]MDO7834733.1 excalibur calcium-binding domain-containing protein [Sphingobium sp. HBC34]